MSLLRQATSATFTDGAVSPADKYDHEIKLVDHTRPAEEPSPSPHNTDVELDAPLSPSSATTPVTPIWTRPGLRHELTRRKYAKYQEGRVVEEQRPDLPRRSTLGISEEPGPPQDSDGPDGTSTTSKRGEEAGASPKTHSKRESVRRRGTKLKENVKDVVRGPRLKHQHTKAETVYDVLYENERGAFFCGIPRFSSKSLLNFDPPAWQTATFHPSPVNITNAQVPDPSWRWAEGWSNWHVDMNFGEREPVGKVGQDGRIIFRARGDTDEEGWRYSFAFGQRGRWAWHGTHPWFHSFVRRRRWVRLRVKQAGGVTLGGLVTARTAHEGHLMSAEYFTIHSSKRPESRYEEGLTPGETVDDKRFSVGASRRRSAAEEDDEPDSAEIRDVPTLMRTLRKATVDRQKLGAVRTFIDQGNDELHYLADNMHEILSLLIFQTSRQQMLTLLTKHLQEAERQGENDRQAKHKEQSAGDEGPGAAHEGIIAALKRAVDAADDECKRLEYWSDTRPAGSGPGHEAEGGCEESDDKNEAEIGKTTVFSEEVADDESDSEKTETAGDAPESAPDRPEERVELQREESRTTVDGEVFVTAPELEEDQS